MARPRKADDERREHRREVWFSAGELASFLTRAAEARLSPPDYARQQLCGKKMPVLQRSETAASVGETLAVMQIGMDIRMIADIAAKSGQVPENLPALLAVLELALDKLLAP